MPQDLTTLLSKFLVDLYAGTFGLTVPISTVKATSFTFSGNASSITASGAALQLKAPDGGAYLQVINGNVFVNSAVLEFGTGGTPDAGMSRLGAASFSLGTVTQGDFTGTLKLATVNAVTSYQANGVAGVATFGPSAVASITVKQGIITAIS
jgi:hypothetical protein